MFSGKLLYRLYSVVNLIVVILFKLNNTDVEIGEAANNYEKFFILNMFLCRHFPFRSDLLFSVLVGSAWRMKSFSAKQRLHHLAPG